MSRLESLLIKAEMELAQNGRVKGSWVAWLSAATAYREMLPEADQCMVGTPRDILNRWVLNGGYSLDLDEDRNILLIRTMAWRESKNPLA